MAFYLNRTGQPEGPYEDHVILQMIQSGQLASAAAANICPPGASQWMPLNAHPPFAQALQAAAGAAQVNPLGPTWVQEGSPGLPAGHPAAPTAKRAAKGGSAALIIAGIAGLVLLVGGAAAAVFFVLRATGPELSASVPKDVELFVEIPNIKRTLLSLTKPNYIDTDKLDTSKKVDDFTEQVAKAFDISKNDARALALAFGSAGVAVRGFNKSKPSGAFLIGFSSGSPVEKWLASKRFSARGTLGSGGQKYELKRKESTALAAAGQPNVEMALGSLEISGSQHVLVWFKKSNLLAIGEEPFIVDLAQVIEAGKEPLQDNPTFKTAKAKFSSDAALVAYLDPGFIQTLASGDAEAQKIVNGYLKNIDPFVASLTSGKAGVLMSLEGSLRGDALPKDEALVAPVALKLPAKLPAETLGYLAFSSKLNLTGKQVEELLLSSANKADPRSGVELKEQLAQLEATLGFGVHSIYDALGDQGVMAITADKSYVPDFSQGVETTLRSLAFTYLQQLKDKASAEKIVSSLKSKLFDQEFKEAYRVTPDGVGFSAEPTTATAPLPYVQVKLLGDHLFVSLGKKALVERSLAAFNDGQATLGSDGAHKAARAALADEANAYLWLDSGRALEPLLKSPLVVAAAAQSGMPLDAIRTSGEDRITSGLSFSVSAKNGLWTYRLETLNIEGVSAFAGVGVLGQMAPGIPMPNPAAANPVVAIGTTPPTGSNDDAIGVAECDDYLKKMETCIEKMPAAVRPAMAESNVKMRETWKSVAAIPAAKGSLAQGCKTALDAMAQNPLCK